MSEWVEFDACIDEVVQFASSKTEILGRFWNGVDTEEADEAMWQVLEVGGFEILETGQAEALVKKTISRSAIRQEMHALRDFAELHELTLGSIEAPIGLAILVLAYTRPRNEIA